MLSSWIIPSILFALTASIILNLVYLFLYLTERHRFLFFWLLSWFFQMFFLSGELIRSFFESIEFVEVAVHCADLLRGYFLLAGCFLFSKKEMPKLVYPVFGAGIVWVFLEEIYFPGSYIASLPIYTIVGGAHVYSGILFLRVPSLRYKGNLIAGWNFILWGIHILDYPVLRPIPEFAIAGFLLSGFFRISSAISILLIYFEWSRETEFKLDSLYKKIIDTSQEGIWIIDKFGNTTFANNKIGELYGMRPEEMLGKNLLDLVEEDRRDSVRKRLEDRKRGLTEISEYDFVNKKGEKKFAIASANPLYDDVGNYDGSLAMIVDVTSFKLIQEKLKESERQISTIISNISGIVYRCKNDPPRWTMEYISEGCLQLTGYSPAEFVEDKILDFGDIILPEDRAEVESGVSSGVEKQVPYQITYRIRKKDGTIQWCFEQGVGIFDSDGALLGLEGVIIDYSLPKKAEELISNSLREKELLLREIHHRVKNYMQVLSSLIGLQSEYATDQNARKVLEDSQNRIASMAMIHETLYSKSVESRTFLPDYIRKLIANLIRFFESDEKNFLIEIECDSIMLNQSILIPLGLILNELITNSMKHAFPKIENPKKLRVEFGLDREGFARLRVTDNGPGRTADSQPKKDSLGTELIQLLTHQLKGKTSETNGPEGYSVTIRFPLVQK
ncbi:PAS domain S-box protein [Leptospira gomenensis]|uniref:histidine kinase n=1 Tax=Leptospira gomenensis TaxID=2484974 RepID=A0A5F1Z1A1_9LEPT|nr:PAS domain S-box protein [Leptospira gomenensis]TGK36400.1 PAS domain S-box protein [Leptospira gomenensis]TGK41930.1 PAS domain S-box protein [Leptospira gomenensis]TGK49528.1 PAS domain S-box protein [Leptospira gomenensis]TGK67578.1 PAS domain S-box protein [Leptospira gomenensis]